VIVGASGFRVEVRVSLLHGGLLAAHGSLRALGLGEDVPAGERLDDVLAVRGDGDLWEAGREEESEGERNSRGLSTDSKEAEGARVMGGSRAISGTHSRSATVFLAILWEGVWWGGREVDVRACGQGEVSAGESAVGPSLIKFESLRNNHFPSTPAPPAKLPNIFKNLKAQS
jgi:hypothetical protein